MTALRLATSWHSLRSKLACSSRWRTCCSAALKSLDHSHYSSASFEYMDIKPTIVDPANPIRVDPATAKGEVVFENVSFTYQESELERIEARQQLLASNRPQGGFRGGPPGGPDGGAGQMGADMPMPPPEMPSRGGNGRPSMANGLQSRQASDTLPEDDEPFHLSDISFTAEAGKLTALVRPSGSGKTTIGYLASRLYDADEGAVRIDGVEHQRQSLTTT